MLLLKDLQGLFPIFDGSNFITLLGKGLAQRPSNPYLVVADSYLTETAQYADIVLPVATYLESWNLDSSPALGLVPFVALQQPIIRPYGQSVSLSDLFIELAHRIGGGLQKDFKFNSTEEYIKKSASKIEKLERAGGVSYLKQFGVWLDPKEKPKYRTYESREFDTPSGKIEIYSERLKRMGFHPTPVYEPIPGHGDFKGKFVLVTFEPNVMGARSGNFMWLAEIKGNLAFWTVSTRYFKPIIRPFSPTLTASYPISL